MGAVYNILIPPYGIRNTAKTALYSFQGGSVDGAAPNGAPVFGPDGALYGTTQQGLGYGGASGCGTAYRLAPPAPGQTVWTKTQLAGFAGGSWPCYPQGSLAFGDRGVLYGFSFSGGIHAQGTLFRLTPTTTGWDLSVPYKFTGGAAGVVPDGGPLLDSAGAVYGAAGGGSFGAGIVFKLTPGAPWTQTVLHDFGAAGDAKYPHGDLIFDSFGAIYGVSSGGGAFDKGTVYRLSPPASGGAAWTMEILFSFSGADGWEPSGKLALDTDGSLYGTTTVGGSYNQGTVFRLAPPAAGQAQWSHTVLASFRGNLDGARPEAGVIIGPNHFLHGTTSLGGGAGCGMAYRLIPPDGANTQWRRLWLHSFACGTDGRFPTRGLVSSTHGELYGVTLFGGDRDKGEIFRLD